MIGLLAARSELPLSDYFNTQTCSKMGEFGRDYAAKNIAFAPAILSVVDKIHLNSYVPCG